MKKQVLLRNEIRGVSDTDKIADRGIEIGRNVDESNLLLLTDINLRDTCQIARNFIRIRIQ